MKRQLMLKSNLKPKKNEKYSKSCQLVERIRKRKILDHIKAQVLVKSEKIKTKRKIKQSNFCL